MKRLTWSLVLLTTFALAFAQGELPLPEKTGFRPTPEALAQSSVTSPGWTGRTNARGMPEVDYAPNKPGAPTVYDDAIARVCVVFWDGRVGEDPNNPVKSQIAAFLRRGLPVSIGINATSIGSSPSKWQWQDIRDLQAFARSKGTELHIFNHGNNNFTGFSDLDHGEMVAEIDPTQIYEETGYRVRVLGAPGDGDIWGNFNRKIDYIQSISDSLGIWYITHRADYDSLSTPRIFVTNGALDLLTESSSTAVPDGLMRPGMGGDRAQIVAQAFGDLGTYVVERAASNLPERFDPNEGSTFTGYGQEWYTGVKPPRTSEWTLTGNGADANNAGIWNKPFAAFYSQALAGNYGFIVSVHDSAANVNSPITGIDNNEIDSAFSPEHVAWVLAMLQKKGHIKVVGIEEYCRWGTGEYAPGTDLIANPSCLIPQFDIGDTLGATSEYPWVRGLGDFNISTSAQTTTAFQVSTMDMEQTGNVAKWDRSDASNPYDNIGLAVTGVRGRKGGIYMQPGGNAQPATVTFGFGNLKPGRYRLSFEYQNVTTSTNPILREMHTAFKIRASKLNASIEAGFAEAFRDTILSWQWLDTDITPSVPSAFDGRWGTISIPINLPEQPWGNVFLGSTATTGTQQLVTAANDTFDVIDAPVKIGSIFGSDDEASGTRPLQPYANGGREGFIQGNGMWAYSLMFLGGPNSKISNPRFVYLGDW